MKTATIRTKSGEVMEVAPPRGLTPSELMQVSKFVTPVKAFDKNLLKQGKLSKFRQAGDRTKGKGSCTSDALDFQMVLDYGRNLIWQGKRPKIGFLMILQINTGLRISDILKTTHREISSKKAGDIWELRETKTKKLRKVTINKNVVDGYIDLRKRLGSVNPDEYIFTSQKRMVYSTPALNTILKKEFAGKARHISTHSLRKTWGKRCYDLDSSSRNFANISRALNHSTLSMTYTYIGIQDEEIADLYLNL